MTKKIELDVVCKKCGSNAVSIIDHDGCYTAKHHEHLKCHNCGHKKEFERI